MIFQYIFRLRIQPGRDCNVFDWLCPSDTTRRYRSMSFADQVDVTKPFPESVLVTINDIFWNSDNMNTQDINFNLCCVWNFYIWNHIHVSRGTMSWITIAAAFYKSFCNGVKNQTLVCPVVALPYIHSKMLSSDLNIDTNVLSRVILVFIAFVPSQLGQNNPLVSAETVRHSSTNINLYIFDVCRSNITRHSSTIRMGDGIISYELALDIP